MSHSLVDEIKAIVSPQNSDGWNELRLGRFTASEIHKLLTQPREKIAREKGELSQTAKTYILKKVAETLTGQRHESSYAYPVVYGKETEPMAIAEFSERTGLEVEPAFFIPFTDIAGGSPDGLIGEDAILEIKCPYDPANQIKYLQLQSATDLLVDFSEYWYQCQANLLFSKRKLCYFAAYDPRYKAQEMQMKIIKIEPNVNDHQKIVDVITKAQEEKDRIIEEIKNGIER